MAKKSILKKVAKYLKSEKNLSDDTKIVVRKDDVVIYPGSDGVIYGYMLSAVVIVAGINSLSYFVTTEQDGTIYLCIY